MSKRELLRELLAKVIVLCDRNVAQPGSALFWGDRGHGFKSRRSDHTFFY